MDRERDVSEFVSTPCACSVDIVSVSLDPDDVAIALADHNEAPWHRAYRHRAEADRLDDSVQMRRGPCICKGGEAGPVKYRRKRGAA